MAICLRPQIASTATQDAWKSRVPYLEADVTFNGACRQSETMGNHHQQKLVSFIPLDGSRLQVVG